MARLIMAGEHATEGERTAAKKLEKLPPHWIVIANKTLLTDNGRSFEIDFIVLGDHLVFAIDEKSWRGRIHGSDAIWVRDDGSAERSPLDKIDYVAKVLAGHLTAKVPTLSTLPVHYVVGCVLLSRASTRPSVRDSRAAQGVFLLDDVIEGLQRRDAVEGDPRVGHLRSAIEKALYDLSNRPKVPRQIGPYTVEDVTTEPYGARTFRVTHPDGGPRTLSVYNIASADNHTREFYLREFRALQGLHATGHVPEVLDPFPWSEDFLVVPIALPMGVSLSALPSPSGPGAAAREMSLAATAFRALAKIHARGVIHRALGPERVYVDGTPPQVTFTGFFAARHGEHTIHSHLDALPYADSYAAPELELSHGFADQESDTYSLALVFLERLSGVPCNKLRQADGSVYLPGPEEGWIGYPANAVDMLRAFFKQALAGGPMVSPPEPRLTAAACADQLDGVIRLFQSDDAVTRGSLLDGRYQVRRLLGTGASARTFLATDTEADGLFVLKQFLRPDLTGEARREFGILRELHSPHLPRVYDVYPPSADVQVKLEYVEGKKLSDCLSLYQGRADLVSRLATDLLQAVELLEERELLHRDIKPDNVIIRDGSGVAVLIDFGMAVPLGALAGVAGTPRFLPPEAYAADQPPPTSDLYSVGVLLFLTLTGQLPLEGGVDQQRLVDTDGIATPLQPLARVLLRAASPDPTKRYPSAADLRAAIVATLSPPDDPSIPAQLATAVLPALSYPVALYQEADLDRPDNSPDSSLTGNWGSVRLLRTLDVKAPANDVTFSPDGRWMAVATFGNRVHLCEAATGREVHTFLGHGNAVGDIAFSPNGRLLAVVEENRSTAEPSGVQLWDIVGIQEERSFTTLGGYSSVAFSPDGLLLATVGKDPQSDGLLQLWTVESGKELHTLRAEGMGLHSVAFSPDGQLLATGSAKGTVDLWHLDSGRRMRTIDTGSGNTALYSVAFSPDGHLLTASGDQNGNVPLWDVASGTELRCLEGRGDLVTDVAFSPDGSWLAVGVGDATIKLWEVTTGREVCTLRGHKDIVESVAFTPDGSVLASGGDDNTVRMWQLWGVSAPAASSLAQFAQRLPDPLASGSDELRPASWMADRLRTGSVRLLQSIKCGAMEGEIAFSANGASLAAVEKDRIKFWNVAYGYEERSIGTHKAWRMIHLGTWPGERQIAVVEQRRNGAWPQYRTVWWDASGGRHVRLLNKLTLGAPRGWIFSPDLTLVAACEDKADLVCLQVFMVDSGDELLALYMDIDMWPLAFASGSRLLTGQVSGGHTVTVWDLPTGRELRTVSMPLDTEIWAGDLSPDGRWLALGGSYFAWIIDVASGQTVRCFSPIEDQVESLAFSPDGSLLSTVFGGHFHLWEVASGQCLYISSESDEIVRSTFFSPDGHLLASLYDDVAVKLWEL